MQKGESFLLCGFFVDSENWLCYAEYVGAVERLSVFVVWGYLKADMVTNMSAFGLKNDCITLEMRKLPERHRAGMHFLYGWV